MQTIQRRTVFIEICWWNDRRGIDLKLISSSSGYSYSWGWGWWDQIWCYLLAWQRSKFIVTQTDLI